MKRRVEAVHRSSSSLVGVGAARCSGSAPASSAAPAAPSPASRPPAADKEWTMPNKNYAATRYSALNEINTDNVKNLKVAWTFSTGVLRGHEGEPLVVGNTMYVHTPFPNIVYALDLTKEGAPIKWKYAPKQDPAVIPVACCDTVNRGVAYADGKIFFNQLDTNTVALDAETGKELWKVKQGDYKTGPDDDVGADGDQGQGDLRHLRRRVRRARLRHRQRRQHRQAGLADVQHRARRPKSASRARSKPGRATSGSAAAARRGAGTATTPSSTSSTTAPATRARGIPTSGPGDNKYSMTIFARDPDTGKAAWAYQKTPHDAWDYDGINENVLVDLTINGQTRKVLVNFDRNGFCLRARPQDRRAAAGRAVRGRELGQEHRPQDRQADREPREAHVGDARTRRTSARRRWAARTSSRCPSRRGPGFYVPTNNLCMDYEGVEVKYQAGQPYVGAIVVSKPGPGRQPRRVHRVGSGDRQEGVGHQGEPVGLGRRARRPPATWSSTARWKAG